MPKWSESDLPPRLWCISRNLPFALTGIVTLVTVMLAFGASNPHEAGPLVWDRGPFDTTVAGVQIIHIGDQFTLPLPPFTVEIRGAIISGDPYASWGVAFTNVHTSPFTILINGYGFLSLSPFQPDFRPFIHIHSAGTSNQIMIDAQADDLVTVRINDEMAWQGKLKLPSQSQIFLTGNTKLTTSLHIDNILLYSPQK